MKITGTTQHIKDTNQERFLKGGDYLIAGEYTVKVKDIEFNDKENRYFTIVFENDEGKQYKHNQFVPPFNFDFQEKQYIELLTRLGIKLNLPDLTFDTDQLKNKMANLVLNWKFNEDQGKHFARYSFLKIWNKGDEVVNKPTPKTDEQINKENNGATPKNNDFSSTTVPTGNNNNPFNNANGPIDISDDLPF